VKTDQYVKIFISTLFLNASAIKSLPKLGLANIAQYMYAIVTILVMAMADV